MSNNLKRAYTMKKLFILIAFPLLFQSCTFINSDFEIIELAQKIQKKYNVSNNKYVTIINYGKSILSNRLYLVDMQKNEIILRTSVSHAWNSGLVYPTKFSNGIGSNKSSIGAFKSMDSYPGKYGYAMRIIGLDGELNNNVMDRFVVFHSNKKMKNLWSNGCFATSEEMNKKIIDKIKGGTLVYVFI